MATTQKSHSGQEKSSGNGSHNRANSNNSSSNFANMDDDKQKEIASKGGKSSHSGSKNH